MQSTIANVLIYGGLGFIILVALACFIFLRETVNGLVERLGLILGFLISILFAWVTAIYGILGILLGAAFIGIGFLVRFAGIPAGVVALVVLGLIVYFVIRPNKS